VEPPHSSIFLYEINDVDFAADSRNTWGTRRFAVEPRLVLHVPIANRCSLEFEEDRSSDLAIALRAECGRSLNHGCCSPRHIEFKNPADRNIGLGSIRILGSHKAKRIYAIDEKTATGSAFVLHHPISVAVLTHHKQRKLQTRGRFGFLLLFHINSP
jgi:hypothetical protein